MRAILSVWDKAGVVDFARGLLELGFEVFSTGGTKKVLSGAGVAAREVSELTGFPEILDGRVKTLHPAVHGGILARRDLESHMEQLAKSGIETIDLVAVNLYPFIQTVAKPDVTFEEAIENIDIGGPTMIRAAAKNFPQVLVLVEPSDYGPILEQLRRGGVDFESRKKLAQKAFQHVAFYDTAVASYLQGGEKGFAPELTIALRKRYDLRYGENPHQKAAFYEQVPGEKLGITSAKQLWGKELSFNNIMDADGAWKAACDFTEPTVVIVKHTNPCGLASHQDLAEAYRRALAGDPVSAFGGIVAVNRALNIELAKEIAKTFYEIVIAPEYDDQALALLKGKKDLRLLAAGAALPSESTISWDYRSVAGGFLIQTGDLIAEESKGWRTVTQREPTADELKNLAFAWRAVKHVKSNAIVVAKDSMLLGMGAGQPSRVDSVEIALKKAGERVAGAVLASDAFFPFPDGVELAAKAGVSAVIEPGGSVRDNEVIEAANRHNVAMVFTGIRHFKH
jgi:phosphoribosylaminoimidazolecarboxamide formyltransferase/IMP cyclohydrolase